jgi:hypothetical protein
VDHDFAGGTTDINEAWIWLRVVDAQGRPIYESGAINQTPNDVDPSAHFYRTVPVVCAGPNPGLFAAVGLQSGKQAIVNTGYRVANFAPVSVRTRA